MTALTNVVSGIVAGQKRMTEAVDNLSAIVAEMRQARPPADTETPAQPRRRSNKAKPAAL